MSGARRGLVGLLARHSAVRYVLVGGLSFTVDAGGLYLLRDLAGVPAWLAAAISFLASFAVNYTLQRTFAFGGVAPYGSSLVKYVVLVIANTIANSVIVAMFDALGAWFVGKVIATVAMTVWNYFLYRYWVFRAPSPTADPAIHEEDAL